MYSFPSATNKYLLTVVNAHNCISKDSIIVTIKGNAPIITIEKDTVCQGNASEISIVSDIAIDSTVWIIENQIINTDTNKHVFSSFGNFPIWVSAYSGECSSTSKDTIIVKPSPTAAFIVGKLCPNQAINFTTTSFAPEFEQIDSVQMDIPK
ncbi:MAG: hypothetical protein IPO21_01270 [Bacteroidales bacterium]|nr:hypothetical protein [Bacteroidales bacterium]